MDQAGLDALSRRRLLRGIGTLGVGAALAGLPLARALAAMPATAPQWPNVTALIDRYVQQRKVSGMIAALGWQQAAPLFIARGREGFDDHDPDSAASLVTAIERRIGELPSAQPGFRIVTSQFLRARAEQRGANTRAILIEYRFRLLAD